MSKENSNSIDEPPASTKKSPLRQFLRFTKRLVLFGLALILGYLLIAIIGLIPVNRDFVETENGIEIFLFSGEFHSDLILPISTDVIDWRTQFPRTDFPVAPTWATHMSFGWGDRKFYLETPTWKDLKISSAANALLFPSETVMHVSHEVKPTKNFSVCSVKISNKQYEELTNFVITSFAKDQDQNFEPIPDAHFYDCDAFYKATGNYHCFKTCNCWAGQAIKVAGIKTGWFTPFPKTPFWYFPKDE